MRQADTTGSTGGEHPDAGLLHLGAMLEAEWARSDAHFAIVDPETDAGINATIEPCSRIVGRIEHMRARTLAGLRVKALAVAWCRHGDPFRERPDATDERLAASIMRDLLQLPATLPA